ncbi:sporulation protein YabP [Clostridium bornimense]|uniref:sporulation protein YabP n=1 Tax=Clostridium bornimense TaxID=1216932 RepID=UPI001C0F52A1|nr:sporulation protein YabP [Clostridium bornimense]MBU5315611.1 sporulation protein YabP [Clostridium bornimense]
MDVKKEVVVSNSKPSNLTMENRANLSVTGVVEVIRFNEDEINLNTTMGKLTIKGKDLKMNKLDVENGDVIISGTIDSCVYASSKREKESILERLFK